MSEPNLDPNWLSTAWQWIAGIAAGIFTGWKFVDGKLVAISRRVDDKVDRSEVNDNLKAALERLEKTNTHIEQLYKNAERDRHFVRDLHEKAMEAINSNQREIISALTGRQR